MPAFKISAHIHDKREVPPYWESSKTTQQCKVVDEHGKRVAVDYQGKRYAIFEKKERTYSFSDRAGRGLMAVALVLCTLWAIFCCNRFVAGGALIGLSFLGKNLWGLVNPKEKIRYAVKLTTLTTDLEDGDHKQSEKELREGITLNKETLQQLEDLFRGKLPETSIHKYKINIFSLSSAPGIVFKEEGISRFANMVKAETVVRTHNLALLVIPRAKLISVFAQGQERILIAEQKLPVSQDPSVQEEEFEHQFLDEQIRQLAYFICKTGYSDVERRNNPLLPNPYSKGGKIALIDLELCRGASGGLKRLISLSVGQRGQIVEEVAKQNNISTEGFAEAYDVRQRQLANLQALQLHYQERKIKTGQEPIPFDVEQLNFSEFPKQQVKLKAIAKQLVDFINKELAKPFSGETMRGHRTIKIPLNQAPFIHWKDSIDQQPYPSLTTWFNFYAPSYLGAVVKALIEAKMVHSVADCSGHSYDLYV